MELQISAIAFAYERFGRHVAPERPDEWLRRPAAQRKSMGVGKATLIISDSGVQFIGAGDYTAFGFPSPVKDSQILDRLLFFPARERWLAVRFTRSTVTASVLYLNTPGSAVNAYYDGEAKSLVAVRHADVRAIGDRLSGYGLSADKAIELLSLARGVFAGVIEPSSKERRRYEDALKQVPDLPELAERAINAEVDFAHVRRYMKLLEGAA